ncbi:flagellar hook-basal body complex protein FliE [Methanocalculus taiwanensis]|uniref:Flagellar hook-basal body complex protein FliE n=1 Tax=Methanocalculus taiwanensis TaxID=106207 RepID=A0ABD4TIA9_9EURY|nr:AAA family ATPase [Methanocalculus taiwanensis]MCQ1537565.1 flagellar hook-basal body complex protein FliE [Methanocalculus taiwanensis]
MKVLGLVGLPASGKGECSAVAAELGVPVIVMGDIIRNYAESEGLPHTDQHLGSIARRLREERGMAALAELTVPAVSALQAPVAIIDGIRGDAEVELFRRVFSDFMLIAIDCPFSMRLARLRARKRSDDMVHEDDLRSRDERECGFGLKNAMDGADIHIENTGSLEAFRDEIRCILKTIGGVR